MSQPIIPNVRKHFLQEMHKTGIPKGEEAKTKEEAVKAAFARCAPGGKVHESFGSITEQALKEKIGNAWDQAKEQFLDEVSRSKALKFIQIYKNYHAVPVTQREPFINAMREKLAEAKFTKSEIDNFLAMTGANLATLMGKGKAALELVRGGSSENATKQIEEKRGALAKQGFSDGAVAAYLFFETCSEAESKRIEDLYGSNPSIDQLLEFFGPAVFAEKLGKIEEQLSGEITEMQGLLTSSLSEIPDFDKLSPGEKYQELKLLLEKVAIVEISAKLSPKTIENSLPPKQLALLQNLSNLRYTEVSPRELKALKKLLENIAADVKAVDEMVKQHFLSADGVKRQLEITHRTGNTIEELKEKVPIQALKVGCLALTHLKEPAQKERQALLDSGLSENQICEKINARPSMQARPITVSVDAPIVLENLNYERQLQDLGFTKEDLEEAFPSYSQVATMADEHVMRDAWKSLLLVDSSLQKDVSELCSDVNSQNEFIKTLWTNVANTNPRFRLELRGRQPISLQLLQYAMNRGVWNAGKQFLAHDLREMATCRAKIGEMVKLGLSEEEIFGALRLHFQKQGQKSKETLPDSGVTLKDFERGYNITTLRIALQIVKEQQEGALKSREKSALTALRQLGKSENFDELKKNVPLIAYVKALEAAQKKAVEEKIETLIGELRGQYSYEDLVIHVLFQDGEKGRKEITGKSDVSLEALAKVSVQNLKKMFAGKEPELLERLMKVKEIETKTKAKIAALQQRGLSEEQIKERIINSLNNRSGSTELQALAEHLKLQGKLGRDFDHQTIKNKCEIHDLQQFFGSKWFLDELNKV